MREHLTRDLFRAVDKGWREPGHLAAFALAHLFELCPACRSAFESWRRGLGEGVAAPEGYDFDAVFDRLRAIAVASDSSAEGLAGRIEHGRQRARSRALKLLTLPPDQRLDWIRREAGRDAGLVVAEALIEESRRRTPGHPHEGLTLASLARIVLQHAPASAYAAELYVRALAFLANAIRVIGDLPRADQVLSDARYFLRSQGSAERLVRAELDSLEASLRNGQDRPDEAIRLLLRAQATYRSAKARPTEDAACLINLARAHSKRGDQDRALQLLARVFDHPGAETDRRLGYFARRNRSYYLAAANRFEDAWAALQEVRELGRVATDAIEDLRCRWTEATILRGLGSSDTAEAILEMVRFGFGARALRYDQALVSLDLAGWYVGDGRHREAEPLVEEALSVFESLELSKKAAAARALRARISGTT